jgi:hypothetical protein
MNKMMNGDSKMNDIKDLTHKEMPESSVEPQSNWVNEQIEEFKTKYPEVQKTLDLFNMTSQQYDISCRALEPKRTYVTTSTILPL